MTFVQPNIPYLVLLVELVAALDVVEDVFVVVALVVDVASVVAVDGKSMLYMYEYRNLG